MTDIFENTNSCNVYDTIRDNVDVLTSRFRKCVCYPIIQPETGTQIYIPVSSLICSQAGDQVWTHTKEELNHH